MMVVSFDPGKTTGYAVLDTNQMNEERIFDYGEIDTRDGKGLVHIEKKLFGLRPGHVMTESFTHRHQTGNDYTAVEVIGVIRKACFEKKIPFLLQSPGLKKFWDNDKLKAIDLYIPAAPHCNDALRHLLYWETFINKNQYWIRVFENENTHEREWIKADVETSFKE